MIAHTTDRPAAGRFADISDNRIAVEVAATYLALPAPSVVAHPDEAHVVVADVDDLAAWHDALGGDVHRGIEADGARCWTLHTHTPQRDDGSVVAVRVHAVVVDDEDVLPELREAVIA